MTVIEAFEALAAADDRADHILYAVAATKDGPIRVIHGSTLSIAAMMTAESDALRRLLSDSSINALLDLRVSKKDEEKS